MNRGITHSMLAFFLALAWLLPGAGLAASYYVDQANGSASDSNPGTETLPWKTLYRAKTQALQPGDTVFVKAGVYDASVGGSWAEPSIYPANSGTAGSPITFKSLPRHGAVVQGGYSAPAIGSYGRSYVVIDGFVVTGKNTHGLNVFGYSPSSRVKGVVVQNNIIYGIRNSDALDNTDGVLIEYASGTIVRNNKIYDVHNGSDSMNAAAIKLYTTDNTLVENNEIYGAPSGVFDKEAGVNNTYRRNYFHDLSNAGIRFHTQNGHPSTGARVYQNIFTRCSSPVLVTPADSGSVVDNVAVYNNVFANSGSELAISASTTSVGKLHLYNNIFHRPNPPAWGDISTRDDPPNTLGIVDYNLFPANLKLMVGRYSTNRSFTTLGAWQSATGLDRHSLTYDPLFVNAAAGDFRLAAGSPAAGAGRTGGVATGTAVDMGAYPNGDETIGLLRDTTAPLAPVLLRVE